MRELPQIPIPWTLAPFSDMDTSLDAAKEIEPHIARLERCVLKTICFLVAASDAAIQQWSELDGNTERPRRVSLVNRGLVECVEGEYEILPSGRNAKLWRITEKGKAALR